MYPYFDKQLLIELWIKENIWGKLKLQLNLHETLEIYVVTPDMNCLVKAVHTWGHNIYFQGDIKNFP